MRKLTPLFLVMMILACVFALPASAAENEKIGIDVLILPKFEVGGLSGDIPGEAQYYYEAYTAGGEEYEIAGGFGSGRLYVKDGIALYLTGIGKVNAALSTMAVLTDDRFDFSDAYVLSTGSAGSAMGNSVMGDVFLVTAVIDYDLGHHADPRDMISDRPETWFHDHAYDSSSYILLDQELMEKVYGMIRDVPLGTTENMKEHMAESFDAADWAMRDPKVLRGTGLTGDNYWKGVHDHANALLMTETYGAPDPFAVTEMEDVAIANVMKRLGMADRLIILRGSVNIDVFTSGSAPETLWSPEKTMYPYGSEKRISSPENYATVMKNTFSAGRVIIDAVRSGAFDHDAENEGKISITLDGKAGIFLRTLEGLKTGTAPDRGRTFAEIPDVKISARSSGTSAAFPADTTYFVWVNGQETTAPAAFNAAVTASNWRADIIQLIPNGSDPSLVISPSMTYDADDGSAFEKLSVYAPPDAFPALNFSAKTGFGECTLTVDPTFSLFSAAGGAKESEAEMVITLFPDDMLSLWIAALDHVEDYDSSKFMLHTRLSCQNGNEVIYAHQVDDNLPVLHENGIMFFDLAELMAGSGAFFSADLDGDDLYETVSSEGYFRISPAAE